VFSGPPGDAQIVACRRQAGRASSRRERPIYLTPAGGVAASRKQRIRRQPPDACYELGSEAGGTQRGQPDPGWIGTQLLQPWPCGSTAQSYAPGRERADRRADPRPGLGEPGRASRTRSAGQLPLHARQRPERTLRSAPGKARLPRPRASPGAAAWPGAGQNRKSFRASLTARATTITIVRPHLLTCTPNLRSDSIISLSFTSRSTNRDRRNDTTRLHSSPYYSRISNLTTRAICRTFGAPLQAHGWKPGGGARASRARQDPNRETLGGGVLDLTRSGAAPRAGASTQLAGVLHNGRASWMGPRLRRGAGGSVARKAARPSLGGRTAGPAARRGLPSHALPPSTKDPPPPPGTAAAPSHTCALASARAGRPGGPKKPSTSVLARASPLRRRRNQAPLFRRAVARPAVAVSSAAGRRRVACLWLAGSTFRPRAAQGLKTPARAVPSSAAANRKGQVAPVFRPQLKRGLRCLHGRRK